jgi:molybdopterin-containing oxidoreductase family iron-sulfur binding subunit
MSTVQPLRADVNGTDTVYWKSLEELRAECRATCGPASGPAQVAAAPAVPVVTASRRTFIGALGAAVAAGACGRAPVQSAIPLLTNPEGVTAGVPIWYASTCGACPAACGLLVKTRDGRPIKIEGNPDSPLFGSGTCAVGQASVLSLYDNERLHGPLWMGRATSWAIIDDEVRRRLTSGAAGRIVLVSGGALGPSTRDVISRWSRRFPRFTHVEYEPISFAATRRAYFTCFGRAVVPHYRFDRADLIVSLDADFLGTWLSPVEFTRQYTVRRAPDRTMARHIHFEPGLSLTGANADARHVVAPSDVALVALSLLNRVRALQGHGTSTREPDVPVERRVLDDLAGRLVDHRGASLVVAGAQDESVQVLAAALNGALGNIGRTVDLADPSGQGGGDDHGMGALIDELSQGEIDVLILYGVNPAYDHPDGARVVEGLKHVSLSVSLSDRLDETATHVHAVCPDHHFLEAWGDAQPVTSYLSLRQPTISPLFDTRAAQDSLLAWIDEAAEFRESVRQYWRQHVLAAGEGERDVEASWDRALERGFVERPASSAIAPAFIGEGAVEAAAARVVAYQQAVRRGAATPDRFELHLPQTVALRDGRHANNPWLQELPDPITKLTWGHAVAVAPSVARRLELQDGDIVAVTAGDHGVQLPVRVQPGQSPTTVSIAVGYGRTHAGQIALGIGANAFTFSPVDADGIRRNAAPSVRVQKTGRREALATTQTHHAMEGRALVRETALATFLEDPAAGSEPAAELPSLWTGHAHGAHVWGMAIDLNACTGCSACLVACQAENNVPVVGKDEVRRGREMHWIRVDRYHHGPEDAPDTVFQPVMCQHCAHAPCETVCPVLATVHSSDGLNQQVYNRCVGTRYCENNCPYKVRRFNWFEYAENQRFDFNMNSAVGRMGLNPDVVVRSRGVMEKCSLCVQRIESGKLAAGLAGRSLADGEIRTACQQACPAQAIVFGDLADPSSRVAQLRAGARHYDLLGHLGTRPGVGYLRKIRNREA